MAKGKPTLFKKKENPHKTKHIELAPRQKTNSKSLEDIEKKFGGHKQKKKEPRKRQRCPRRYRSLEMYHPVGVEDEKPRHHLQISSARLRYLRL